MSEHAEQVALFRWAALNGTKYPALRNLFAIPNGGKRSSGWWEKSEGLKSGVPDIFLACAALPDDPSDVFRFISECLDMELNEGVYFGLFIEMKFGKNKPSPNQLEWIERLTKANYKCIVCYGWEEARDEILNYLGEK
tara:strand:- start:606 stop:1019 length:414 start_codon:yes stop_codon:yes gene_type:complete